MCELALDEIGDRKTKSYFQRSIRSNLGSITVDTMSLIMLESSYNTWEHEYSDEERQQKHNSRYIYTEFNNSTRID